MNPTFWHGKKVFLTGHTGFKGSWLALWLQNLGAEVTGYSLLPPTQPNLFELAHVAKDMQSIVGDVRDFTKLHASIVANQPEIVIHLAAQALVKTAYDKPVDTYATNVMGTVNLLEAVRQYQGIKAVIIVTSDKCYENREWLWAYRENEPLGGYDPYSNSKGCAELVTSAYRASYFNPEHYAQHGVAVASTRAGNVIGGGDWAENRLVPDVLKAFIAKCPAMIRYPRAIRPWQHVLEPLHGYLTLAEKLWQDGADFAEGWNFGPEEQDAKTVGWIVEQLAQLWGENASWHIDRTEHPHEANYLKLDCSKAKTHLHWFPKMSLETAFKWTVDWYRGYCNHADLRTLTQEQIHNYQNGEWV